MVVSAVMRGGTSGSDKSGGTRKMIRNVIVVVASSPRRALSRAVASGFLQQMAEDRFDLLQAWVFLYF